MARKGNTTQEALDEPAEPDQRTRLEAAERLAEEQTGHRHPGKAGRLKPDRHTEKEAVRHESQHTEGDELNAHG